MIEFVFIATAYSWGCGAGDLTRIEVRPTPGFTVAVDPTIIQLGSAMEIGGKLFRAEDTGSDIVGNRVDLMMDTCEKARAFGRREVKVRIREDLDWHSRLSGRNARLATRLVSIRGSRNLQRRLSSVSDAEVRGARRFATSLLRDASASAASPPSVNRAVLSSLLEWAQQANP